MDLKNLTIANQSSHKLKFVGYFGTSFNNLKTNIEIEPNSTLIIGQITVPKGTHVPGVGPVHGKDIGTNNWGWIYLEDTVNAAQFELFCFVGCTSHVGNRYSIGYKTSQHNPDDATPNIEKEGFLKADENSSGFTYTIKEMPADSYIFKLGTYTLNVAHRDINIGPYHGQIEAADHTFVTVTTYDGSNSWYFDCYGGHGTKDDEKARLNNAVVVCRGGEDSLKLAKAICCFNPNAEPKIEPGTNDKYFPRNFVDDGIFQQGQDNINNNELFLGNCSGLVYARTGVCHQMANRILASAKGGSDTNFLSWADVAFGKFTQAVFGSHGRPDDIFNSVIQETTKTVLIEALLTSMVFPQAVITIVPAFLSNMATSEIRDIIIKVIRMVWQDPISDEAIITMKKKSFSEFSIGCTWNTYFDKAKGFI